MNLESREARDAKEQPHLEQAFICHLKAHWFAVRRVGGQWFDFNSLHAAPQALSDVSRRQARRLLDFLCRFLYHCWASLYIVYTVLLSVPLFAPTPPCPCACAAVLQFYLSAFLLTLKEEGWTVLVVRGVFPDPGMLAADTSMFPDTGPRPQGRWYTPRAPRRP